MRTHALAMIIALVASDITRTGEIDPGPRRHEPCNFLWSWDASIPPNGGTRFTCVGSCQLSYPTCAMTRIVNGGGSYTLSCDCYNGSGEGVSPSETSCYALVTVEGSHVVEHLCTEITCSADCKQKAPQNYTFPVYGAACLCQ